MHYPGPVYLLDSTELDKVQEEGALFWRAAQTLCGCDIALD